MMPGMIMGWPWSIESIPSGWHLCDGTMGTPDYRNCYLAGAGDAYNPGDSFGNDSQAHSFTGSGHYHDIAAGTGIAAGTDKEEFTDTEIASGITDPADNRPQTKAINWIMKL